MRRRLRRDISYYKYLNSGAIPRQSKSAEEILDVTQRIEGNLTERENDSEEVLSGVSESSNQHSAQVVSLDTNEVSRGSSISSTGNLRFPSVPPSRSPLPSGWSVEDIDAEFNKLSRNIDGISVIVSGSALLRSSQSAPVSPIGGRTRASSYPKRRSPFLGISSLSDLYRPSSNQSLEWDNYTFFQPKKQPDTSSFYAFY